jgi:hypothetical protein
VDEGGYEDDADPTSYEEAKAAKFQKDWGLYHMIAVLAEGSLVEMQKYFELPIISIFNHLSYQLSGGVKTTKQS